MRDVVVVGAGVTGTTLACLLADAGLDVVLVEAQPASTDVPDAYGLRTSSISPASQRILEAVGAWARVPTGLRTPYRSMHVFESPSARPLEFDSADAGLDVLGHIVDNAALVHALERATEQRSRLEWRRPVSLDAIFFNPDDAEVELAGETLRARLVVGADGTHSRVRDEAGLLCRERDFEQRALVTIVRCAGGHRHTAWQRFLPTGPVALLPLDGDRCSLIWSTTPEQAEGLAAADAKALEGALADVFAGVAGPFTVDAPRASFPLRALEARSYVGPRTALVGDAAHTVHPLAGQGVNLGLLDAAMLAEVVDAQATLGRDIGLHGNLVAYERRCRGRNLAMGRALEAFHDVFGARAPLLGRLRSAGLSLVDRLPAAKRAFVRAASGEVGEVAEIARPARYEK